MVRWGGGVGNKYVSSTFVDLSHPEMALQAAFRTGSIFEACSSLGMHTQQREKHRARAVLWESIEDVSFMSYIYN